MTIKLGGIVMPAALEAVGEYNYPEYEVLAPDDGGGNPVLSRYMTASFVYPQGLRNEFYLWWVDTVLQGAHSRTFTSFANQSVVVNNGIVFRNYQLEHQAFKRAIVHRPTGVKTRMGYRREGVEIRITGMIEA